MEHVLMTLPSGARIVIAHDYLTQRGGAERVVLSIAKAFPDAPIVTSMYEPALTFPEFADLEVITGPLDRWAALRQNHRLALPLLPFVFPRAEMSADVIVCSSSGWAHGAPTDGSKVVYCHNPARWLYQTEEYLGDRGGLLTRAALGVLRKPLERWDKRSARSADVYLANSSVVRRRIAETYSIEAEVLPPPVSVDPSDPRERIPGISSPFVLCVSRLLPYKHIYEVIEAFRQLSQDLIVVGNGPQWEYLTAIAPSNVRLLGTVTDEQLRWLYSESSLLVAAAFEDFGLTPVEAAAFGVPSAVLRQGGYLDTTVEGRTGLFFDDPTPIDIRKTVEEALRRDWSPDQLRSHAERFSEERFVGHLRRIVSALVPAEA